MTSTSNGLKIVSCYQYGKQDSADWLGGQNAGVAHAKRGWQLHVAAGGSYGGRSTPRSMTIRHMTSTSSKFAPYLRGWEAVLGHQRVGVYANSKTIEWAVRRGWAPTSGSTTGDRRGRFAHPAAHLHQVEIDKRSVGGVGVDINHILQPRFGQWD